MVLLVHVNLAFIGPVGDFFNLSPPYRSHPAAEITFINFNEVCGMNPDCSSNYAQLVFTTDNSSGVYHTL